MKQELIVDYADMMSGLIPELKEVLLEHIINKVDNIDIGDQTLEGRTVSVQYNVFDDEASIEFSVEPGVIKGVQLVDVSSYYRGGSDVKGHLRTYVDQRVFRLSNGDYITIDTLPSEVLEQAVTEAFDEALEKI